MSDQPQQFGNPDEYIDKAKDYARQNPDQARSAIDKVEDFIDEKTGGRFSDQVDAAGDFLEGQLGLPNNTNNPAPQEPTAPSDPTAPADPQAPANPDAPIDPQAPPQI